MIISVPYKSGNGYKFQDQKRKKKSSGYKKLIHKFDISLMY